jgi:hypothetical protein
VSPLDDAAYRLGIRVFDASPLGPPLAIGGSMNDRPRWRSVLYKDGCAYCGRRGRTRSPGRKGQNKPGTIEVDHVAALAEGGDRSIVLNGTGCCVRCNRSKGKMPLLQFLLARADGRV